MQSVLRMLWLSLSFGLLACNLTAQSMSLDQVLTKIEQTGKTLSSMEAELQQRKWTDILQEYDEGETGRLLFLKKSGEIFLRKDIQKPQPNHLVIRKGEVVFYQPSIKQAQKHQLGQNKDKAEFLLLGFGTSRKALEEAYNIKLLGESNLGGRNTYMLELTPRSQQVSAYFARIVLWIDSQLWLPVQQRLIEPTDDYLEVRFQNIKLNPKLSPSDFELKLPKDVKLVGP